MGALQETVTLILLLVLVSIPVAQIAYGKGIHAGRALGDKHGYLRGFTEGRVAGYTAAEVEYTTPGLEIIDTHLSGKVEWRYGTGRTELTGLCHKSVYPASALDTVAAHHALKNEQRHLDAADELVDDFFSTHGPFRNLDNGL